MQNRPYNPPRGRSRPTPQALRSLGLLLVLAMAGAAAYGISSRTQDAEALKQVTEIAAVPSVNTTTPKAGSTMTELVLPGTVQAIVDAPIYARTNGYLKSWKVDIGAHVHRGQLMAEIDTPEVNDQLRQAEADLNTAKANAAIAKSTAERWLTLVATDSVTRQETDEKLADAKAKEAIVASATANLERLKATQNFNQVLAPFDGIVTARKTDVGALINAGSGQGVELFHMVDHSILRVYVQVPQVYAAAISVGQKADLKFAQYPGRLFPAKLARTADAIDAAARTLLVEFQVDNSKGELLPGSYTEVHFTLPITAQVVRLPINTLIFRGEGVKVARVTAEDRAELVPVVLGRDMGSEVEIKSGLNSLDRIVISPPDSLVDGQAVRVVDPHAKDG